MIFNHRTSRHLVVTLVLGQSAEEIYSLSQQSLRFYSEKIGADFACIRENVFSDNHVPPHYTKLKIQEYLEQYDRVLFLDCDVIVSATTPNIFELVPEDAIGVVNEGALVDRSEAIKQVQKALGNLESWKSGYFNSGVIVVSKLHKDLFVTPEIFYLGLFREQSYLNWKARSLKYKICYLDKRYNYFFHPGASLSSAYSAYIVHFAGWGFQLPKTQSDSKHTYKYHQMKCFLGYLAGQMTIRVNPEQLCLVAGFINQEVNLRKFTIPQGSKGLVSYGPYIEIPAGLYKIVIDFSCQPHEKLIKDKQKLLFVFDVVSHGGNKMWYRSTVLTSQKHIDLLYILIGVQDLEIRFYATGVSFSLNFIEMTLLESEARSECQKAAALI